MTTPTQPAGRDPGSRPRRAQLRPAGRRSPGAHARAATAAAGAPPEAGDPDVRSPGGAPGSGFLRGRERSASEWPPAGPGSRTMEKLRRVLSGQEDEEQGLTSQVGSPRPSSGRRPGSRRRRVLGQARGERGSGASSARTVDAGAPCPPPGKHLGASRTFMESTALPKRPPHPPVGLLTVRDPPSGLPSPTGPTCPPLASPRPSVFCARGALSWTCAGALSRELREGSRLRLPWR